MHDLPPPIHAYISTHIIGPRMPAYLLVDRQYRLIDWGGDVAFHGLNTLSRGQTVSDQLVFLQGMLPLEEHHLNLQWMELQPECYVDVHVFACDIGMWVLLLDATAEATRYGRMQQKVNDATLIRK